MVYNATPAEQLVVTQETPMEIARAATGIEGYVCGDEGWDSTCLPELGIFTGVTTATYIGSRVFAEVIDMGRDVLVDPSVLSDRKMLFALIVTTCAAPTAAIVSLSRRRDSRPQAYEEQVGETDYAVLSGRRLPRDTE